MNKIKGNVDFTPRWWFDAHNIETKSPMEQSMDEQIAGSIKKSKILYEHYGYIGVGQKDPDPVYQVPQYDGRILTASEFGGKKPGWDPLTACYWWDKSISVWGAIEDPKEIAKIKVPNWDNNPLVNETIERFEKEKNSKYFKDGKVSFPWTFTTFTDPRDGIGYNLLSYMTVVDLAPFLYGDTEFFSILIAEENLAYAITDKCYEISTSYAEYMQKHFGLEGKATGWGSIGGDYSCVMSPALYEKYCKPYDLKRMEHCKKMGMNAINLHSCGKSLHLYDVWAKYPDKENIKVMQTRGVEGQLKHLRECLPHTWIQWTLHQPQCDFENISQAEVEKVIRNYAAEADFENIEFTAIVVQPGENTDKNIAAFFKTIEKLNEELADNAVLYNESTR